MFKYILKRIGLMILTLFIILSIVFVVIRSVPGAELMDDPSVGADEEVVEKPLYEEYKDWIRHIFPHTQEYKCKTDEVTDPDNEKCYDQPVGTKYEKIRISFWGYSDAHNGREVFEVVKEALPLTIFINVISLFIAMPVGIFLGTLAALRKNKPTDHIISIGVVFFISVPSFVLAYVLIFIFAFELEWLEPQISNNVQTIIVDFLLEGKGLPKFAKPGVFGPEREMLDSELVKYGEKPTANNIASADEVENMFVSYWHILKTFILPVAALTVGPIAALTRYTRAELTEVLTSDFMLLAKSKGLTRTQATIRHAFRNSMLPLIGMIISMFVGILGGSLLIETVFGINGMGSLSFNAVTGKNYNMVIATTAFYTTISLLTILFIDLMYGVVDPRVRLGGRK